MAETVRSKASKNRKNRRPSRTNGSKHHGTNTLDSDEDEPLNEITQDGDVKFNQQRKMMSNQMKLEGNTTG
jgi:hypothetical protein